MAMGEVLPQGNGATMALPKDLTARLERALAVVDDQGTRGTRLLEDARRLCGRIGHLVSLGLLAEGVDSTAMEVCCFALQLPLKTKSSLAAKTSRTNLKERTEQSAEMLISLVADLGHDELIEQVSRLLADVHQKRPISEQARLLADALNLEDFGVTGLVLQMVALTRQGQGVTMLADGLEKREQYGYWEARLNDGFHFEASRQLARKRLEAARKVAALLAAELKEDGAR